MAFARTANQTSRHFQRPALGRSLGAITETTISKELDKKDDDIDGSILRLWELLWTQAATSFSVTGQITKAGNLYSGPGTAYVAAEYEKTPGTDPVKVAVKVGDVVTTAYVGGGWYYIKTVNGDKYQSGYYPAASTGSRFNATEFKKVFLNKLSAAIQIEIQAAALKAEPISDIKSFRDKVKKRLATDMCKVKSIIAMGVCPS